jgi:hypothetical protein
MYAWQISTRAVLFNYPRKVNHLLNVLLIQHTIYLIDIQILFGAETALEISKLNGTKITIIPTEGPLLETSNLIVCVHLVSRTFAVTS